jgi:hypothetical protein
MQQSFSHAESSGMLLLLSIEDECVLVYESSTLYLNLRLLAKCTNFSLPALVSAFWNVRCILSIPFHDHYKWTRFPAIPRSVLVICHLHATAVGADRTPQQGRHKDLIFSQVKSHALCC